MMGGFTQYDGNSNTVQVTRTELCTITQPTTAAEVFISATIYVCLNRPVATAMQGADGSFTTDYTAVEYTSQGVNPSTLFTFTGPGPDNTWFTDDDTQSGYGANEKIFCGYRFDAEAENYYVRNRFYSPPLGRWLTRDPIGYQGGINPYAYVESSPVGNLDAEGLAVHTYGVPLDNTPNGPAPLEVWHDATAPQMLADFMAATGNPIVITGGPFLRAVEGSWELKLEGAQYRMQLLNKVKEAAKQLKPGQSTTVKLDVRDFTYTMP